MNADTSRDGELMDTTKKSVFTPSEKATNEQVFWFDVSDRALVSLRGPEALDLLHRISTNDLLSLPVGASTQTILTNEKGRIVDVLSVFRLTNDEILAAGCSDDVQGLISWLNKFIIMEDVVVSNVNTTYKQLLFTSANPLFYHELIETDAKSVHVLLENWGSVQWSRLLVKSPEGNEIQIRGNSLIRGGDREFNEVRVRNHVPGYPNEINIQANPLELNLIHLVSLKKGCYVGQEVIARLDTYDKVQKRLCAFEISGAPRSLPATISYAGNNVGTLTSFAQFLPTQTVMGLGFLSTSALKTPGSFSITEATPLELRLLQQP